MLFNSFTFIVFFCIFCIGWPFVRKNANLRWIYIISFSLFFYGWWNWRYVFLLIATGIVDFSAGLGILYFRSHARSILWASIAANLIVLGFFKYSLICAQSVNELAKYFGADLTLPLMHFILPVGISFYTFQSMSYTIDVYNKKCHPTHNLLHFISAISLFPHLVAGPIMRASKLLPQLLIGRPASPTERAEGLRLIAHGFFKKVVIADNLAGTVNDAFGGAVSLHTGLEWWVIVTMFAMQIYCDFSGYSDIARGLAKWLGYDFTLNFAHPYSAISLKDFWNRWHISLSTWFRDYVYIPLGGSKNGEIATCRNIAITMILSALWHGAGFTYFIWGVLHAIFLCVERITRWPERLPKLMLIRVGVWLLIFMQVLVAWVFFRATSAEQGLEIVKAMFTVKGANIDLSTTAIVYLLLGICHEVYTYQTDHKIKNEVIKLPEMIVLALVIVGCVFLRGPGNTFIYFQF